MATSPYTINYDNQKFQQVKADKQTAITEVNDTYNNMINQSDQFYGDQIKAVQDYANSQKIIQQQQTDFAVQKINQQKDKAEKDYKKEQSGAYVDWQKQSNQYGVNAEQMAAQGMTGTGFSESSQVSMYNTYQNRIATARETYNNAVLNYDNSIKEAQLQNSSTLAEIAYNALQSQLEMSLEGFQYKNSLIDQQLQQKQQIEETYHNRWMDVLNQMNTENALAEQIRQFDEEIARLKAKDTLEATQAAQQLELQKKQLKLQQDQLKEEKRQFDLSFELEKKNLSSSGSPGSSRSYSSSSSSSGSNSINKTKSNGVTSSKGHHSSALARKAARK